VADDRAFQPLRLTDEGDGIVVVAGELDLVGAAVLRKRLTRAPAVVVLDLRGVTFIDAAGLRALEAVPGLVLRGPSNVVLRLFDLLGLTDLFAMERASEMGRS
jgi:anti-anti-sigma factor